LFSAVEEKVILIAIGMGGEEKGNPRHNCDANRKRKRKGRGQNSQ